MPPRRRVVKKAVATPVNEPEVNASNGGGGEFTLKTTVGLFRQIADAISTILRDTNIFYSDEGLYIQGMDPGHVSCFESRLTPSLFDEYHAPFSGRIGVNIQNLILILSTAPNTDVLVLTIEDERSDTLDIAIENDTGTNTYFGLRLMDLDDELMDLPPLSAPLVMEFDRKYLQELLAKFSKLRAEDITMRRDTSGLIEWNATTDITTIQSILAKNADERDGELTEMEQELLPMRVIHEAGSAFNLT